jgi:hypothetical protein
MPAFGRRCEPTETRRALSLHPLVEHALPAVRATNRRTTMHALRVPALNQLETSTCVGHAFEHAILAAPLEHHRYPAAGVPDAFAVYRGACLRDEFTDNDDGNLDAGSSGRGAAQWLLEQGVISHFDWCEGANGVADWIGARDAGDRPVGGPVLLGTNWYWWDVQPDGFLETPPDDAEPIGGHEVCLLGWNERGRYFTGVNSWGPGWGMKQRGMPGGRFRMSYALLDTLFAQGADACALVETT